MTDQLTTTQTDGLENVQAGLGTPRDKRYYSTYGTPRTLDQQTLENMYRTSWLVKRIVNAIPDDMTREWRCIHFGDADLDNAKVVETEEKRLGIKAKVNEALRWARLYGGALIIIGTKDKDLSQPLDVEAVRKGDLQWLRVVDRWRVSADAQLTTSLQSDNFMYPEFYTVADTAIRVHHSRVLRFDGQPLPYQAFRLNGNWHDSEVQHTYDSVINYDTTAHGIATMIFEANVDVVEVPELNALLASKQGEANLIKRFQVAATMKSFNRTLIIGGGEKYSKHNNTFANLDKVLEGFMQDVCGACDIPATRLFGMSPKGMNATGESDLTHYYDMVAAKQESDLRNRLEYLDQILVRSVLGTMPQDYEFTFNSLWQMTDAEVAEIQSKNANRDKTYLDGGVIKPSAVAKDLKEKNVYANITDEDIKELEDKEANPPEEQPTEEAMLETDVKKATLDVLKTLSK